MKRNLPHLALTIAGVFAATACAGAAMMGCSDDDTVVADAGVDSSKDSTVSDGTTGDATPDRVDTDVQDGGGADVLPDVPALQDFPRAVTTAACEHIRNCCLVPVAGWDQKGCIDIFAASRGWQEVERFSAYLKAGDAGDGGTPSTLTYDKAKADECLRLTRTFSCGIVKATDEKAMREACGKAISGTIAVGAAGCRASVDCVDGYCGGFDGGVGTCLRFADAGQPCGPADPTDPKGDLMCSRYGLGITPAVYCQSGDGGAKCAANLPIDAGCKGFQQCASGQCDPEPPYGKGVCVTEAVVTDPGITDGFCDLLTIKDAGGGG